MILRSILHDSENLMSLAVDAAAYYEKNYRDTGYLDGLEAKRREVEKSLANLVKVIESGLISETVTERLVQLEEQKRALNEAIEAENIRAALCEDEHTIKAYFEKFLHADFDNPETRDQVLEYFVDKIYLTDDGLVVTSWYSEDRTEVTWDMLYGEDGNPFVKGEAVKFDCFPFGSTILHLNAFAFGCFLFAFIHTQGDPKFPKPQFRNKTIKKKAPTICECLLQVAVTATFSSIVEKTLLLRELILANTAQGAYPILGQVFKLGAGGNAVVRIAHLGVITIAANVAYIDFHWLVPPSFPQQLRNCIRCRFSLT